MLGMGGAEIGVGGGGFWDNNAAASSESSVCGVGGIKDIFGGAVCGEVTTDGRPRVFSAPIGWFR